MSLFYCSLSDPKNPAPQTSSFDPAGVLFFRFFLESFTKKFYTKKVNIFRVQKGAMFMPGPARGPGMGRRGGPEAPWAEEADRAWARGQEALCLHPLRRDGLAAFIGGPIPVAGVLDA